MYLQHRHMALTLAYKNDCERTIATILLCIVYNGLIFTKIASKTDPLACMMVSGNN